MTGLLMDGLVLILLFLIIWKINIIKPLSVYQKEYLSMKSTTAMKGILSIVVLFHHLAQRTSLGIFFHEFSNVGYLAVAIFFFLSGYALLKKHMTDEDYHKDFLKKRFPSVLIPYIVINIFYWIYYAFTGIIYSLKDILISILKGSPLAYFSWYVVAILIFYLVFDLLMRICKKHYYWMIFGSIIYCFIWIILCSKLHFGQWWYNTIFLLVIGMLWALFEKRILWILNSRYRAFLFISFFLFLIFYRYPDPVIKFFPIKGIKLFVPMTTAILFTLLVILLFLKFRVGNRILDYLGTISFELYLSQGIFVLYGKEYHSISNDFLFSAFVLMTTVLFSHFLHKFINWLLVRYKRLLR